MENIKLVLAALIPVLYLTIIRYLYELGIEITVEIAVILILMALGGANAVFLLLLPNKQLLEEPYDHFNEF